MGRITTLALTTAASLSLVAAVTAGVQRAPAIAQRLQLGPIGALGVTAPNAATPAQPFASVKTPDWSITDRAVNDLQACLKTRPEDAASYAQLGSLYLQKVRETGDPSYYQRAEGAIQKSLELAPSNVLATVAMGGLRLSQHNFSDALVWGEKARAAAPRNHVVYGIVADGHVELGHYPEAIDAVQAMVDIRPELSSYSRISYLRELHGDLPGAIEAMRQAAESGAPRAEGTNWARIQLGNLLFLNGDLEGAGYQYRYTLHVLPGYVHGTGGLARLAAARGDYKTAIDLYSQALKVAPLPEYATALADVYRATGDLKSAAKQEDLVRVIAQLQRASGVDVDLDMALFEVDHAPNAAAIEAALQTARAQHALRPENVHAQDVLAWALFRAGKAPEALPYARQSLRLGTQDPSVLYHAGAIAAAAGERDEACGYLQSALAHNPNFHVRYAPAARSLLDRVR